MRNYDQLNKKITELVLARSQISDRLTFERKSKKRIIRTIKATNEVQVIAQVVAQGLQKKANNRIASIVSKCLASVFEEPYIFNIVFEAKRGKTEARLVFNRNGMEVEPLTASGGGVVDVAAFALRLSCLLLSQPPVRKIVFLDEPFKFVSLCYRENVKEMFIQIASELGIQFVMVTHIDALQIGDVREL